MIIIPAIDLKDGRCVRLRQGRADDETVYAEDPVAMARHWAAEGAEYLHVVDLDGAFRGSPAHREVIAAIAAAVTFPVEVGGGIRTAEDVAALLACGVARVIMGTRAAADPAALSELAATFGDRLVVGVDARDGMVQVKGWVETTGLKAVDLAADICARGVSTLIYTDTATDGMMRGPNVAAVREICRVATCDVVASGGITSVADVAKLARSGCANLVGAIVGKALYEKNVSLPELTRAARGSGAPGEDSVC